METIDTMEEIVKLGTQNDLLEMLQRLALNFVAIFVLIRLIYYPLHKNKDFLFTFFLFNLINFLICFLLSTAKLKIGFAFGLFAIFSILRYRTVTVPVREMGYFFISVTLGIINALVSSDGYWVQLLFANGIIILFTYFLDYRVSLKHENYKEIIYDRIDLIGPEQRDQLIADLRARTGLPIHRIEFLRIDLLKDTARIYAFYFSDKNESSRIDVQEGNDD